MRYSSFLPLILLLFPLAFLSLEDTGYMASCSFVINRVMRACGLLVNPLFLYYWVSVVPVPSVMVPVSLITKAGSNGYDFDYTIHELSARLLRISYLQMRSSQMVGIVL